MELTGKIQLSTQLEDKIFGTRLTKRELTVLKNRCESYQAYQPNSWNEAVFRAYSHYFGFLSAVKVRAVLEELYKYDFLADYPPFESIVDFGAGTLGASLGAFDDLKVKPLVLLAQDVDLKPMQWAQKEFQDYLPAQVRLTRPTPEVWNNKRSLILAVDVWNEAGLMQQPDRVADQIKEGLRKMDEDSIFIWIEPASKSINQKLLTARNLLLQEESRKYFLWLPCTHEQSCPALADDEWCHEDRDYGAPSEYWSMLNQLGFHRSSLSFSVLVWARKPGRFKSEWARIVSRNIRSKGKCEKWLCSQGKRWKQTFLTRHQNEETDYLYRSQRGDILDCSSTLLKPND